MRSSYRSALVAAVGFVFTAGLMAGPEGELPPGVSASPELQAKLADAQRKLEKAEQAPAVKRLTELSAQFGAIQESIGQKQAPLQAEMAELWNDPEAHKYNQARSELEEVRREIEDETHDRIFSRAKALYSQRHQELKALAAPDLPHARKLGMDVLSYPRVDGSTSMQPLATIACSRILGSEYAWCYNRSHGWMLPREPRDDSFGFMFMPAAAVRKDPYTDEFTLAATYPQAVASGNADPRLATIINNLLVRNTGTHDAYMNLIGRKSDLALLARKPSADELAEAAKSGVELSLVPIGFDALVFIVNEKNAVKGLSQDHIRAIYAETITSWKAVGGSDEQIIPFRRDRNSGSQELYEGLLLGGKPMQPVDEMRQWHTSLIVNGMGGPYNRLFQEKEGIAFSVFCYEHFMAASPFTRALSVDGVEPSLQTIASGEYPLRFPVYAVHRKGEPAESAAMRLLAWLLGSEGQQVVRESGLVQLPPPPN